MTTHHSRLWRRRSLAALVPVVAAAVALAGCGSAPTGSGSAPDSSPYTIGQTSIATSLDPYKSSWALAADGVAETVFMQDAQGNEVSRFVEDPTQTGDLDWTMKVKDAVKFSDGSVVDAAALATSLNDIQAQNTLSNASAGKITFTADGTTLKARTERPTTVLASVLGEWTNVVFKKSGDAYVYTGPYTVKSFVAKESLSLTPNPHYPDASRRRDVTVKVFSDVDAMKLAVQSKSIDMAFTITPTVAEQLRSSSGVKVKTIDAGYQYFGRPNLTTGPLTDPAVRQAIDAGVDRGAYLQALGGGQVATGLFAHIYPFAGKESLTVDKARAAQLLDQAGYVAGADGMRAKDGQPLTVRLVTYVSRPDLSTIMQIMVSQLKELGIAATTSTVQSVSGIKPDAYDLVLWAQHTAPTGEPGYFLNQFFRTGASNNITGYSSAQTDALLDQLGALAPGADRSAKAVEIQRQLRADQAVLMLVDPQWHIAVTDRLAGYQPYCGDYYVVNPKLGLD
ncbi:MAG: ABC transporter substrate-binding protein [Actinomycetia bacterium]|nr:ABC transporter substrate-binding protein [Actinomycetes bacterium]